MTDFTNKADFGSGNVFKDIGVPDPEQFLIKADLACKIAAVVEERGLTQSEAARLAGTTQSKISLMMRGQLSNISTDRLLKVLNRLGVHVSIILANSADWAAAQTEVMSEEGDEEEPRMAMAL